MLMERIQKCDKLLTSQHPLRTWRFGIIAIRTYIFHIHQIAGIALDDTLEGEWRCAS